MRTMYIILSWIGWGWFLVVVPTVAVLLRRQRRPTGSGSPIGTEAEAVHEQ